MANFARVGRFRLEIGIGVARLPSVIFASGMSESEEKIGVARLPWLIFASGMSESEGKIGVARLPWIIFANGMSESEEISITATLYPSSAPSCSSKSLPGGLIRLTFLDLNDDQYRSESVQKAGEI